MNERIVVSDDPVVGRPLDELKQPWRALHIAWMRRVLRRHPVQGLLGIDRSGRLLWARGYPKDPNSE